MISQETKDKLKETLTYLNDMVHFLIYLQNKQNVQKNKTIKNNSQSKHKL